MLTVAAVLLVVGYALFYSAVSQLVHGPGHGVGLLEAMGLHNA